MTAILAAISDTSFAIGGDAGAFEETGSIVYTALEPKVFRLGKSLVGVAGSFRTMEVAKRAANGDPYALRDHLQQILGQSPDEFSVLVVNSTGIYEIAEDYSVLPIREPYVCVGAASGVGTGALAALYPSLEPKEAVKAALVVTARHSTMCVPPFKVFSDNIF